MRKSYIAELKKRLDEVNAAISEVISTGQSYTIQGSHGVTHVSLAELKAERRSIHAEIRQLVNRDGGRRIVGVRYE